MVFFSKKNNFSVMEIWGFKKTCPPEFYVKKLVVLCACSKVRARQSKSKNKETEANSESMTHKRHTTFIKHDS